MQTVRMRFDNFTVQICSQSPVPFFVDTNRASLSWPQIADRDRPSPGSTAPSRDKESACRPYALQCYVNSMRNVRYITNAGGSSLIATVRCGDASPSDASQMAKLAPTTMSCCFGAKYRGANFVVSFHDRLIIVSFHVGQCTKIPARCQCRREGV